MFFENLQSLFGYVLEKKRVLIYGDLGRSPYILVDYLSTHYPHLRIFFVSMQYSIMIPNHVEQFREIEYREARKVKCDLLVLLEPLDHSIVYENYSGSSCVAVFTSHAVLDVQNSNMIDIAIHFRSIDDRIDRIRRLSEKLEGTEESEKVLIAVNHIKHSNVITIGPDNECDIVLSSGRLVPPPQHDASNLFVVVNLTTTTRPVSIFLCYLDAFDYMAENLDRVERWSVCFGLDGARKYENFVQECIDRLHCMPRFTPYLRRLLPLLPFYKSGTIGNSFDIDISRMVNHEYVSPNSLEEAFNTSIAHNTQQLVGGVLSIIK